MSMIVVYYVQMSFRWYVMAHNTLRARVGRGFVDCCGCCQVEFIRRKQGRRHFSLTARRLQPFQIAIKYSSSLHHPSKNTQARRLQRTITPHSQKLNPRGISRQSHPSAMAAALSRCWTQTPLDQVDGRTSRPLKTRSIHPL
jgi:hypothetical protein